MFNNSENTFGVFLAVVRVYNGDNVIGKRWSVWLQN